MITMNHHIERNSITYSTVSKIRSENSTYLLIVETNSESDSTEGLNECKCNQSCDYDGPRIWWAENIVHSVYIIFSGSDGIFYRNQCKLDATNCELGIEISPSEVSKCQNPEPSKPKPARFPEIERPESEMNDSQINQIIEPPIEDLTDQKSSRSVLNWPFT